jgi:FixJ family two-component response regulator
MPGGVRSYVTIEGGGALDVKLRSRLQKVGNGRPMVVVGYHTPYAVFVHENLEIHHKTGQAKFLEQPLREHQRELATVVQTALKAGRTLQEAEFEAGAYLLNLSKPLVPVDTGQLRDSGDVRAL